MALDEGRHGARLLYALLAFLTLGTLIALGAMYVWAFNPAERNSFAMEISKALLQIFTVAVIGSLIKLLIDDQQRRQREANEDRQRQLREAADARVRAEQNDQRLEEFRTDKVRRLVNVTNILRRAPILIDAHRSAKTYNEQMREIVNAGLELRLIRHETDAIGADRNPAFAAWPEIREGIRRMEKYVDWIVEDFREHNKPLSELQRRAEAQRDLQGEVWQRIQAIQSVRDLLGEVDGHGNATRYAGEYLEGYGAAMRLMIRSSLEDGSPAV